MTLGQYLYIDELQFKLEFLNFFYYQNGGDNVLLNIKTKEKKVNVTFDYRRSLSEQLKIPLLIKNITQYYSYSWDNFEIIYDNKKVYGERLLVNPYGEVSKPIYLSWGCKLLEESDGIKRYTFILSTEINHEKFILQNSGE